MPSSPSAFEQMCRLLDRVDGGGQTLARLSGWPSVQTWDRAVEEFQQSLLLLGGVWGPQHAALVQSAMTQATLPSQRDVADALAAAIDSVFHREFWHGFAALAQGGLRLSRGMRFPLYDRVPSAAPSGYVWSSERSRTRSDIPPGTSAHVSEWSDSDLLAAFDVIIKGELSQLLAPLANQLVPVATVHPHLSGASSRRIRARFTSPRGSFLWSCSQKQKMWMM